MTLWSVSAASVFQAARSREFPWRELDFPCTKVIIAQRISTTKTADKIIVLQNGYIKEMGTHEELMEKKGYYYELVKLQTGVDEL